MKYIFFILVLALNLMCQPKLSDLRPEKYQRKISQAESERGRALLRKVAQSHGLDTYEQKTFLRANFTFSWPSMLPQYLPEKAAVQLTWVVKTDNSLLNVLLPNSKRSLGIQYWSVFERTGTKVNFFKDENVKFWLPTMQYFFEISFRLLGGTHIAHVGEKVIRKVVYDLVLVTWADFSPQRMVDQYLVYVDRDKNEISFVQYTVRDKSATAIGTMMYTKYQNFAGLRMPLQLTKVKSPYDLSQRASITVKSYSFPKIEPSLIVPEPNRRAAKNP